MPIPIRLPALSPTMTDGHLVQWLKSEGDSIRAGDILAEVETDKATMEIEACDEGVLGKILVSGGTDQVLVNTLIGVLLEEEDKPGDLEKFLASLSTHSEAFQTSQNSENEEDPSKLFPSSEDRSDLLETRIRISPVAKRMASHHHLDVVNLKGSGPRGRIIKSDIEHHLHQSSQQSTRLVEDAPVSKKTFEPYKDYPLSPMRRAISKRLTESKQTIPHFYLNRSIHLDSLLDLRRQLNESPRSSTKISVNDLIIKACGITLQELPTLNASWSEQGVVRRYSTVDISVAVAVEGGLITPIVRSVESKSPYQISVEMKKLAERARSFQLKPEEYQGGGFSISNLGMCGVESFQAIINPPQIAILAVGAGIAQPVVDQGTIQIRTVMNASLSIDHRALDGSEGSQFLTVFKKVIENPYQLLMDL
jgi:pyruvate dehydrogenase E2 component (dihydrolipoamide acetyltransferase)